jgi:hypothetical protein
LQAWRGAPPTAAARCSTGGGAAAAPRPLRRGEDCFTMRGVLERATARPASVCGCRERTGLAHCTTAAHKWLLLTRAAAATSHSCQTCPNATMVWRSVISNGHRCTPPTTWNHTTTHTRRSNGHACDRSRRRARQCAIKRSSCPLLLLLLLLLLLIHQMPLAA